MPYVFSALAGRSLALAFILELSIPLEPFAAGLGNHKIVTTLCPGGRSTCSG
jgi:hypothetical protein